MKITVFGGSKPQPGEPAYLEAWRLGESLGTGGHTVLTGGYIGTMEAVSRGVVEAGGHTIGVTCEEIEAWRPVAPNAWVQAEIHCQTLLDRLSRLITECQVALALPGGAGTLTEIALMWNLIIIEAIPPRPLILIGSEWQGVFHGLFQNSSGYIPASQRRHLQFAVSIEDAVQLLPLQDHL